jgi:hypothetical protein
MTQRCLPETLSEEKQRIESCKTNLPSPSLARGSQMLWTRSLFFVAYLLNRGCLSEPGVAAHDPMRFMESLVLYTWARVLQNHDRRKAIADGTPRAYGWKPGQRCAALTYHYEGKLWGFIAANDSPIRSAASSVADCARCSAASTAGISRRGPISAAQISD